MKHFECDYACGAHPQVLAKLVAINGEENTGYGVDPHCERAQQLIREACQAPHADVHFLVGGTQANMTVIAAALRPHQGAVCAASGHINDHETGAVEATGHKCLTLPTADGKITAEQIDALCHAHYTNPSVEHTVQPGLVYLSMPTEMGTVYSKSELTAIREVADRYHMILFVDGARLAYGLAASDLTLPDMARLCDVFYLGGTKAGALCGEAVVITKPALQEDFRYLIKQRGAMLAKGWQLGAQFEALMEDGLFFRIGQQAVARSARMRDAFLAKGWSMLFHSPTNQQFPILPDKALAALESKYSTCFWEKVDAEHTAVRFCTGWSTTEEEVDALIADIQDL